MKFRVALIATFASMIGCGDNSNECGPGTQAVDGLCTPTSNATCSDGTVLDTATGGCVIDPSSCQDGTVLIGNACVDPGHVTADLEEGPEPNGLGVFGESSNAGAGTIALKPVGSHFVVHGKIIPFRDDDGDGQKDADYDTYTFTVSAPTLLAISADGLHGLAGGFATVAAVSSTDPLASWQRLGVNLVGDTSKRQVYLPQAGTYALVIADTRTLFLAAGAAGAADGEQPFEYYVTVDALAAPVPQALTVTAGAATSTGSLDPGEVKFFTVPMGTGFNNVTFDAAASQVVESVVVTNTHGTAYSVKGIGNSDTSTGDPASLQSIGYFDGDTTLIVADNVYNYASEPTDYTLTVATHTAGALSKTGGTAMVDTDAVSLSTFYYDVASADEITGLNITVDKPVSGVILDQNGFIFSYFTYDPNSFFDPFDQYFTHYQGLIREPAAGRYYLAIVDEALSGTDVGTVTATSTYGAVTLVAVTEGTATASQATNAYASNPFTYDAGTTDVWQTFGATGGTVTARFFTSDSYGRLDTFKTGDATCVSGAGVDNCVLDAAPLWAPTLTGTPKGRILLDDGTTNYLVVAHPTAAFTLDFQNRPNTVLTAVAGGTVVTDTATLDLTNTVRRYLIKTAATNNLAVSVDGNTVTDAVLKNINNVETALSTANATGLDGIESFQTIQGGNGWTAVTVNAVVPAVAQGFTISATATAGTTYTKSAGTTTFSDACTGGTVVTLSDSDEGVSAAIAAPTNFQLFGFSAPTFHVFSNGFLSFETATCVTTGSSCYFSNTTLPTTTNPNAIIAPYWDDLDVSSVCTKVAGTKLIVQWTGTPFGNTKIVDFQAILDGSNNTIEFVYAADQDAAEDGIGATVGVESTGGLAGYVVGFNTAATVAPATAIKLTPM